MLDHVFITEINSTALRRFAGYWATLTPGRLPRRSDIDPADFVWLLGHVFIIDVIRHPALDFRFRLFGTEMAAVYGSDLTGRCLSELDDADFSAALRPDYIGVAETAQPSLRRGRLEWFGRGHIHYERLILPLAGKDGCRVDQLLGATIYGLSEPDGRNAHVG